MEPKDQSVRKRPINPFVDWGFKYLFGREETKDLLMGFLNLLLNPDVPIREIRYLNPEVVPDRPDMKRCLLDVLCEDENGDQYLVEMQKASRRDMANRLIYYACRLIDRMGRHSNDWDYAMIKRVYAICLMDFTYEKDPHLRSDIQLCNSRTGRVYSDLLNIITLQIPCIRAKTLAECRESYEKLLFLLRSMSENMKTTEERLAEIDALKHIPEETKAMFRRVVTTVEDDLTEDQWRDYEIDLDKYQSMMIEIETGKAEGWEKGHEEGRAQGLAEGLAEGRAEGRAEGQAEEQKRIAKALFETGVPLETIVLCTGVSEKDLRRNEERD